MNGSTDEMRPYRILVKETDYDDISKDIISINDNDILNNVYFNKKLQIIGIEENWVKWVENRLINTQTKYHTYKNVLTEAAIIGLEGDIFARTVGLNITKEEFAKIKKLFSYDDFTYSYFILYLYLAGKKYRIIHYQKNFVVYLVRNECGVTIAKSNKTYIIGIYNNMLGVLMGKLYDESKVVVSVAETIDAMEGELTTHAEEIEDVNNEPIKEFAKDDTKSQTDNVYATKE